MIFTVDIDSNAPSGQVDVLLSLSTYDDSAINLGLVIGGGTAPCFNYRFAASGRPIGAGGKLGSRGVCASNFIDLELEQNTFTVEALDHPSTPNNLAAFDTNNSCFIDDPEQFAAIDSWVDGQTGDDLFFEVVDVWVVQSNVCASAAATSVIPGLTLDRVELKKGFNSATFNVSGQGIEDLGVEIFSLSGELIYSAKSAGSSLRWNNLNKNGAPVANGTYLYSLTVFDADGNQLRSGVEKLVLLR